MKNAAQPQTYSGSELSSTSTNGDKITQSDSNANHEPNDKFIFSSTSMEFAVSRKIAKYRQKNVSSDDINGHKPDGKNNLTGSSSGGSGVDGPDGADGIDEDINFNKMPTMSIIPNNANAHSADMTAGAPTINGSHGTQQMTQQQVL